jgi:hypothetical protein
MEKEMNYQLPPRAHSHRENAAERAIRTFKEHFKSFLATVDPVFLIHLLDRLFTQAETTLNMLRQPPAAAQYHGVVDYNKTAFGPPSCKIIALGQHMANQDGPWLLHAPL